MRLKKRMMQPAKLKAKAVRKDLEGNSFPVFLDPVLIEAEIWPANSHLQIELYGQRITSVMNMLCGNDVNIAIGDGITYRDEEYQVISKKEYSNHCYYEIEKL